MKFLITIVLLLVAVATASVVPQKEERIIGGSIASAGQFPYAVGLITRINILLSGQCAGSLLSNRFILTSASCVSGIQSAVAVIGGLNINDATEPGQIRPTITQFIVHNGYIEGTDDFDVAFAVLPIPISFTDNIRPVRLPNRRQVEGTFVGRQGTFLGWGRFGDGTSNSDVLRFGSSSVITNLSCRLSLPTNTILNEHICTDGYDAEAGRGSPCQGDSGAPLTVVDTDGITTLIGVFSFHSILGCDGGRATVFTRLSAYLDWIQNNSDILLRQLENYGTGTSTMKSLIAIVLLLVAVATASVVPQKEERIIGGSIASAGQFPYAVGLITRINVLMSGQCAGSLLSNRFILTSASCVSGIQSAVAVIGGLNINDASEAGQVRQTVTQFIVHNGYIEGTDDFDVAFAVLPIPISFTDNIRPVRLPNRRQVEATFVGQQGTFMGWGRFGDGTSNSDVLRFGRSQVITNLSCRLSLPTNSILDEHICTEGLDTTAGRGSPCQGDSGAPLTVVDADGITTLVGVFSFHSILGCDGGRAAVFTRISAYLDWIQNNSDIVIQDNFQ
ncbi:transmembrane protease serine 9-like [Armigeres subalbatus]|uniref:transmembrane protease serine 9-like n=1 Tax=Armigeres subalbatus TaxID=124917 RepID=UPI002ED398EE